MPGWLRWAGVVIGLVAIAALAFAIFEPIQVLPRIRVAPGFSFVDQHGAAFTSEDTRGRVTLYSFAYGDCGDACDAVAGTMAEVAQRLAGTDLGGQRLDLVTVSFDPVRDVGRLAALASASGADGIAWRWVSGEPERLRSVLGEGFGLWYEQQDDGTFSFDPRFVLVDGWGVIRGEYRYSTMVADADKLERHIGLLGDELRNAHGAAALAYEAAHIFLCYP